MLFADDTNLHLSHNNIKSLEIPTANKVDKINNWINANKSTINYKKRCFMLVGNKQAAESDFNLCINHIKIEQSDHVKNLGVHLDSKIYIMENSYQKTNLQIIESLRNDL